MYIVFAIWSQRMSQLIKHEVQLLLYPLLRRLRCLEDCYFIMKMKKKKLFTRLLEMSLLLVRTSTFSFILSILAFNIPIKTVGKAALGGPWVLVDQDGVPKTDASYRGKFCLLYFGFTYCPDICPTELVKIGQIVRGLG